MSIKKTIKRMGRCFIALKQENEGIISQSVLLVDNGYSWLGYLHSALEKIKDYFPNAEISVLTFAERKAHLHKDFPTLKFILPSEELRLKRYQIALQMLKIRKTRYDFITLFSLDRIMKHITTIGSYSVYTWPDDKYLIDKIKTYSLRL